MLPLPLSLLLLLEAFLVANMASKQTAGDAEHREQALQPGPVQTLLSKLSNYRTVINNSLTAC
jgi:hypothetical protein